MSLREEALELHRRYRGKIQVCGRFPLRTAHDLSLAYTPGVAEPCREIHRQPEEVFTYTARGNLVAVVTDGTAVLGLGDIGPLAALPVMEGKALLFKAFAGVDAFPLCLQTADVDEIVRVVTALSPSFGGINLEDISAPRCFEIERRLQEALDIPVFHDDQHGTAVVVLAALFNALQVVGREMREVRVVVNGAGAAGVAIARLLLRVGVGDLVLCDREGALIPGRGRGMNPVKEELAALTNREGRRGSLAEVLRGAEVFIGVSGAGVLTGEMVARMAPRPVVFALANPDPEIDPRLAREAGAAVVATGRSDFPNQVNNVLGFPGIFRGALDARATAINEEMKLAAARAIASLVEAKDLERGCIIPAPLDRRVAPAVAAAVAQAAVESGVARARPSPEEVAARTRQLAAQVEGEMEEEADG
ncbi:MAG: malic enzyme-like NAD(P)-binding protein [Bacillota bacterium]|nr:malic enzyme-like NAD(P)-binding protein [Bacillota bacterium]